MEKTRKAVGDTFVVKMFGIDFFFVFSPVGLQSLYSAREADASFTAATKGLLGLKLPPDAIDGSSMVKFHKGLRRGMLQGYLRNVHQVIDATMTDLGPSGEFELFAHMKTLVHKIGFLCWVGPRALAPRYMRRLVAAFTQLDPEESFKSLFSVVGTIVTLKYRERRALDDLESVLKEIWEEEKTANGGSSDSDSNGDDESSNLASLHALHQDAPESKRYGCR